MSTFICASVWGCSSVCVQLCVEKCRHYQIKMIKRMSHSIFCILAICDPFCISVDTILEWNIWEIWIESRIMEDDYTAEGIQVPKDGDLQKKIPSAIIYEN